jgi:histone deacetylase HOS3
MTLAVAPPLALHIQPACLEHKYIRHKDSSHIFERPERLRAVLLGFAAALARLEAIDGPRTPAADDLSALLGSLSLTSFLTPTHLSVVPPPPAPSRPGQVLLHHPALQLAHSPPIDAPFPYLPRGGGGGAIPQSAYLKDLFKWASEAVETIRNTGCEIPADMGLNAGDLYLGPGSVVAIEGAVQTVCHAVDGVCAPEEGPSKAFCAIRPPGHHCGEDEPSGFCYVNNVVVGAMHGELRRGTADISVPPA